LTTAAEGGLKPAPVSRFRGAYPHQSSSCALLSISPFVLVAHVSRLTGEVNHLVRFPRLPGSERTREMSSACALGSMPLTH